MRLHRLERATRALLACALLSLVPAAGIGGEQESDIGVNQALLENDVRLSELTWLAGTWTGEAHGTRMEEHWTLPHGGIILGLHRDVRNEGRAFFEYLRIESTAEGVFYQASPKGKPAVPFEMVEHSSTKAVFENPEHDYPQRITYRREGDVLIARIESITDENARVSEWRWERRREASSP
jgi:hypothetical protein